MSMKNPLTPSGIEPGTFRFVAQHLRIRYVKAKTLVTAEVGKMYRVKDKTKYKKLDSGVRKRESGMKGNDVLNRNLRREKRGV